MAESIQKEDWERFRALGKVPKSIREVVLQSWRRTETRREIPSLKRAPRVTSHELEALRERSSMLRASANSVLNRAGTLLLDTGSIVLMCDANGIVLDADGDRAVLERASENHLHLGGRWNEDAIGTNAIGTALHLRRPVQIDGVEHFCEEIQRWSCAATPVLHPVNGALMGVVDISGPAGSNQRHAALVSASLAAEIGGRLREEAEEERQKLVATLLATRRYWSDDEVLLLDRFGGEVFATELFPDRAPEFGDVGAVRDRVRNLREIPPERLVDALAEAMPAAEIEIVEDGGSALGAMIVLPSRRRRRRTQDGPGLGLDWISGGGPEMERLCERAARLGATHLPVLIEGETGVGKELLARAIARAAHAGRPFEMVYCGELTADRLREEDDGAGRIARLLRSVLRSGGVLCLDEPAAAAPDVQSLLFHLLKAEGISHAHETQARVIALSGTDLHAALQAGQIRSDLYFMLNGARLHVPPLRERPADIRRLARHFAEQFHAKGNRGPLRFTPPAMERLQVHDWPGNVRQLRNLVEQLSALSMTGLIELGDLPPEIVAPPAASGEASLRASEKQRILDVLNETGGNLTASAHALGIARSTLYLKLHTHGIQRPAGNAG
ncbi:transcriptional regulator of acetoin/glycerol metabolism [Breoghania corrubedonensis]|uniref:Transcriptional regulator of acetoin/glycerol metabolism n=1 Tax=Breoghania corrubedonensis TaxID=665038 RepID=A0A2T5VH61_9HYPH|nr:sigma 54-interacting transcriptional regulator [Breoghania corrubedonensis]PTW63087.1 transcriptional regulator of acetoin/glycerol metabolism [Breoghania corrubedonensis]